MPCTGCSSHPPLPQRWPSKSGAPCECWTLIGASPLQSGQVGYLILQLLFRHRSGPLKPFHCLSVILRPPTLLCCPGLFLRGDAASNRSDAALLSRPPIPTLNITNDTAHRFYAHRSKSLCYHRRTLPTMSTRFSFSICLLALTTFFRAIQAHTVITYPGWRGNNLHSNGTATITNGLGAMHTDNGTIYPFGMQWQYPCTLGAKA